MSRATRQPYRICRGACRRHSGGVANPYWTLDLGVQRVNNCRSAWSVKRGTRSRESLPSAGAHGQNTLTILRSYERRATDGETTSRRLQSLTERYAIIRILMLPKPEQEGLSRARRPSGGSRWSPRHHQSQKGGRKGEIEYKVEGRRASHRVLRIEMDSRF